MPGLRLTTASRLRVVLLMRAIEPRSGGALPRCSRSLSGLKSSEGSGAVALDAVAVFKER